MIEREPALAFLHALAEQRQLNRGTIAYATRGDWCVLAAPRERLNSRARRPASTFDNAAADGAGGQVAEHAGAKRASFG